MKMPALAITDHGNLFGAIDFYKTATDAGIKPIIGCEIYLLTKGSLRERTIRPGKGFLSHFGYQNLCRLSSIAHLEGFYYKPRIDKETLAAHAEGLICLTGCLSGEIPRLLQEQDHSGASQAAEWLLRNFGEDYLFFELMRHGIPRQDLINTGLIELAKRYSRPLVATNDCHYLTKDRASIHDVLLCIQTAKSLDDPNRLRMDTDQFYFRSPEEMKTQFKDIPEAIKNTISVAELCNLELDFKTYHFPKFEAPSNQSLNELLVTQAQAGLEERWPTIEHKSTAENPQLRSVYQQRLTEELECIIKMGFAGYFLIVADFIRYAKQNGIPVGPGRGSAAGSLVAYCLFITDVDPIPYALFFERFLNPERISMPDMDIDFCVRRRDEVIHYVQEKYGNVGQIITFGKLKAKAAIRDVGRVMGIPYGEVDRIAKLVPNTLDITLEKAVKQEPQLQELIKKYPRIDTLITNAKAIEGFPRHASTHAAGIVISDRPLTDFLPLYRGSKGETVTQYNMKNVEQIGLIKFDFLGLKTMTIIYDTMALIESRGGPKYDLSRIDLRDDEVFTMLSNGDTTGVFQLESSGMTDLIMRLKPSVFEDIVALVALFRPGPLGSGMVDDFINCKHGRTKITYPLPQLEPILKETYGVILYQEQVMQISSLLANYSLGEADLLRRAMGKKKPEEMTRQKERFMSGAKANNIPLDKAKFIFDLMEKFAGYGFNKAHSVAYALIAYHTAFFKTHHPTEYYCALLTNELGATDKVLRYMNDAKAHNIEILPPDINESEKAFTVVGDRKIRFGFTAVKNVGEGAIESIVNSRQTEGAFLDLFNFCERIDSRLVNRRVLESMIKCGAFDSLGTDRATLWASLNRAMEHGAARSREKNSGQENLFAILGNIPEVIPEYTEAEPWDDNTRLTGERDSLGFYITGHPLSSYQEIISQHNIISTDRLLELPDQRQVRLAGVPSTVREITTKRGDRMGFVTLEDLRGTVEVVVFAEPYQEARELIKREVPLCIVGTTDAGDETVKIIAQEIFPLEMAPVKLTQSVHFHISTSHANSDHLNELRQVLAEHHGSCRAYLHLIIPGKSETVMELPPKLSVTPSSTLTQKVAQIFGGDNNITRFK